MADDDLLTVTQAANALGTTSQTIRNWIQAKRLNAKRIGNRYRIPNSEIDRLGASATRSGESPWEHAADQPFQPLLRKTNRPAADNTPDGDMLGG
ncbi:MAG TPA: helix-turn-helix domain-containing protein [Solirubrobacteraceae bacterium]|nr:helix-turn-helix domain-containing protein [Solirubrobacteraceae bacterium]